MSASHRGESMVSFAGASAVSGVGEWLGGTHSFIRVHSAPCEGTTCHGKRGAKHMIVYETDEHWNRRVCNTRVIHSNGTFASLCNQDAIPMNLPQKGRVLRRCLTPIARPPGHGIQCHSGGAPARRHAGEG